MNRMTNKRMSQLADEQCSHQLAGFVTTGAVPAAGFGPVVPDELPKPKINRHTQILISIIIRGPDSSPAAPSEQRDWAALVLVSFHVEGQVVRSREATAAYGALERFGSRVLPEVARQLIRTGEPPITPLPRALVWLFARVSP